ncbi:MAG: PAS domain S-box protein [Planctomycetota bacterium]
MNAAATPPDKLRLILTHAWPIDTLAVRRALKDGKLDFVARKPRTKAGFLRTLQPFDPHAIVMDCCLEKLSALEVLALLRVCKRNVPVFVLAAPRDRREVEKCLQAGAREWIRRDELERLPAALLNALKAPKCNGAGTPPAVTRESDERYAALFEANPHPMWVFDVANLRFLAVNDAAVAHYGYTRDEFLGMTMLDIRPQEDIPSFLTHVATVPKTHHDKGVWRHRKKDGTLIDVEITSHTMNFAGRPVEVILANDITARKRAEGALRASEERYRAFIEQSSEGIWRYELDQPIPVNLPVDEQIDLVYQRAYLAECNDAMARMYGFTHAAELVGTRLGDLQPRSDPRNIEFLRAAAGSGFRLLDAETHEVDKNGQAKYFLNNLIGIVENGMILRAWGTQRDITERKRMEEALRESEGRYRLHFENNPVPMWIVNLETLRFLAVNAAAVRHYGYSSAEFMAMTLKDIRPEEDMPQLLEFFAGLKDGYHHTPVPFRHRKKDGSIILVEITGYCSRQGGMRVSFAQVNDVTERLRAEKERLAFEHRLQESQKLESLGVLAGGIAHDFNNLLAAVLGNVNLASMQTDPASPILPYLASIEIAAHRAADLCKQMLAYAGKGSFTVLPINLNTIINELANLLRVSIGKHIRLKLDLAAGLPLAQADATQIRQVLMNLIINASEAIGEGDGAISLATGVTHATRETLAETCLAPDLPEGDYLCIEVADTGCGMDERTRARIFDPFFSTKFQGRGLGLAAVLGIVRGHQGAIKVDSVPGEGSTFRVLLPCLKKPEAPGGAGPSVPQLHGTVLVVEDDATLRSLYSRLLEGMGLVPLQAADGAQGLELLRTRAAEITAALLHSTAAMPGLSGEETYRAFRGIKPDLAVVLMSAYDQRGALESFPNRERTRTLQKPFTRQELYQQLSSLLGPG